MDAEFLGNTYPTGRDTYHTFVAAHEFGHILGFRHEQDRTDSTCHNSQDFNGVGIPLTPYDGQSIMNYCNAGRTALSEGDKDGFRKAYSFLGGGGGGGGQCVDTNAGRCATWAQQGRCTRNPVWMRLNCCASCIGR